MLVPLLLLRSLPTTILSIPCLTFITHSMANTIELISPSNTCVGWIGLGVMGRSMCSHLIKANYTLIVFNRTLSKAQPLLDMRAHLAQSTHHLASQFDIVFSIVGYPSDVYSILLDPTSGALSSLRHNGILIDMTTSEPFFTAEISAIASSKDCFSIDTPVSDGNLRAKKRKVVDICQRGQVDGETSESDNNCSHYGRIGGR